MPEYRTDTNRVEDGQGNVLSETTYQVDVTAENNDRSIRDAARNALATNRTYVGVASPTAAQNVAQIKALSRQNNGLIRLLLGLLDGTD